MSRDPCQIYALTPPSIPNLEEFKQNLQDVLTSVPIACLQIRLKDAPDQDVINVCEALIPIAHENDVLVLVNDRPDLAKKCDADGAHIGQSDMNYLSSRELLGKDAIIGVTCHNSRELAFKAAMDGADYVAFGAFFETTTKSPKYRADLEILSWWSETVEIPCVAIGGITPDNAQQVVKAGADFIAVSSGLWDYPEGASKSAQRLYEICQSV